ncbi:interleukin-6 receptor subunit beta-like [Hippocampus comes]|uniref:interleukin-6 receptor subunit beta-like n=1 Tax=Hippocampus comes TaxID=109280 RepID=UPI00094F0D30|nr:PREDICTED: interleukin-6 receptor subunit beta-like [Hippocampus comes]
MHCFLPFVLLIVTSASAVSEGQSKKVCDVTPKDPYIQVGSDTRIVCESFCARGNVYWTLNNKVVDESWSHAINSTHNIVSLRNFTQPKATVQCHRSDTGEVLGGTTVRTYSKPTKIGCIWHYKNAYSEGVPELFKCDWEHGAQFPEKINYTVLISRLNAAPTEICSSQQLTTCTSDDVHLSRNVTLPDDHHSVTVRAKTKYWEVYSDPYEFKPHHILKIQSPKLNLQAISGHLLVKWTTSVSSKKHDCQVRYNEVGEKRKAEVLNKTLEAGEKGTLTIKNIDSCTYYKVSVRCAWDKAPWSNWSREETVLSQLNRSDIKLHLWRKVIDPGKNGTRKVHAMWKEIPSACQGTFTYLIQQSLDKDNGTQVDDSPTLCWNSTCTIIVNEDAYRVRLVVFDKDTYLAEDSVYVPAVGETGLPQVANVRTSSTGDGVILVSWDAPSQLVSGYVIDWTHDELRYRWKESNSTSTTLSGLLDKKPYDVTITPLVGDKTGLGARVSRICATVTATANFSTVKVEVKDKSALVSWDMERPDVCSGVIVHYIVFYGTGQGTKLNVTVNATTREILLKDLLPYTQYSMYVKAVALTGASESNVRHFNTKRFDPRFITNLCVVGSIVIVLVLSTGLCCAIQYRKFLQKPLPNPGLSSVALWPSGGHQKGIFPFRLFNYPPESFCARVYTDESQLTSTPDINREEYSFPALTSKLATYNEKANEPEETPTQSSSAECPTLLLEGSGQLSPYRSQSSVESPTQNTEKERQCLLPVKHQQLTASLAMYVTVDMFEQDRGK